MRKIRIIKQFTKKELFEKLVAVCLNGQPDIKPYVDATFSLSPLYPSGISIPQNYVLEHNLRNIIDLWLCLKIEGIDIFKLEGYIKVEVQEKDGDYVIRDILPPIVEISKHDNNIMLLNDGMHRLYLPWLLNKRISVVIVRDVNINYPYYAFPFEGFFKDVKVIPGGVKPDGFDGKSYRLPGKEYKKLFRDFNSVFENVTFSRRKENQDKK